MRFSIPSPLPPLLAVFLILTVPARSEANDTPPPEIRIRALLLGTGAPREIHLPTEEGLSPLRVSRIQPSAPLQTRALNPFPVFERLPEEWDGENPPRPDAMVTLPADTPAVLLLVSPGAERSGYVAIPDNLDHATDRDWLLINTTPTPIAFQLGQDTSPVILRPRSQMRHQITTREQGGAAVTAAARIDGEPSTFFSTYWPLRTGHRGLVLFLQDGEDIIVRRITEAIPTREDSR